MNSQEKILSYLSNTAFICKENKIDFNLAFDRWLKTQSMGVLEGAAYVHELAKKGFPMPWKTDPRQTHTSDGRNRQPFGQGGINREQSRLQK
jgi:hypothetical protein